MVTDIEFMDSKIALLTSMITTKWVPNQNNMHRQIVDIRRQLIEFKALASKIKTTTGIDIIPYVTTYLSM